MPPLDYIAVIIALIVMAFVAGIGVGLSIASDKAAAALRGAKNGGA